MNYRCLIMVYAAWVEAISANRPVCTLERNYYAFRANRSMPPSNCPLVELAS
jgi:hypothetical protein